MRKLLSYFVAFLACAFYFATVGFAKTTAEVFDGYVCLKCHHTTEMDVGPSFRMIAARYKGDPSQTERLINVVLNGGVGNWSQTVPMPPITTVERADAEKFVKWILSESPTAEHGTPKPLEITPILYAIGGILLVVILVFALLVQKMIRRVNQK